MTVTSMRVFDGCPPPGRVPPLCFVYTAARKTRQGQLCASADRVCVTFNVHTHSQINTRFSRTLLFTYLCGSPLLLQLPNVFYFGGGPMGAPRGGGGDAGGPRKRRRATTLPSTTECHLVSSEGVDDDGEWGWERLSRT